MFYLKVTVTSEDGDYYEFPCNKWLDKRIDDGRTSRELIPRPQKKAKIEPVARQPLGNLYIYYTFTRTSLITVRLYH